MDLEMNADDRAFRDQVRRFLDTELTADMREASRLNSGVFAEHEIAQRWYKTLHKKGWIAPTWPAEYGGTGWTPMQRYIYDSEAGQIGTPSINVMGLALAGPVLMQFGTDAQKEYYLPRILSGEDTWCQGYSEPGSGSDLASLQTRALADGDDYVVNGSKIWTTGAQYANLIFCLVRTSEEGKKQEGISFLIFPMDTPGIDIQPIINIADVHSFNQVFFEDVRVPKSSLVGAENDGWTVAKYLLEFERGGSAFGAKIGASFNAFHKIADQKAFDDPLFAQKVAAVEIQQMAVENTEHRIIAEISRVGRPGHASSIMKVLGSETDQRVTELFLDALNVYAAPHQPEARMPGNNIVPIAPGSGVSLVGKYLHNRAASIYSGSNEIQRNIIAKRVLSL